MFEGNVRFPDVCSPRPQDEPTEPTSHEPKNLDSFRTLSSVTSSTPPGVLLRTWKSPIARMARSHSPACGHVHVHTTTKSYSDSAMKCTGQHQADATGMREGEVGGYGWARTTDLSIMSAAL